VPGPPKENEYNFTNFFNDSTYELDLLIYAHPAHGNRKVQPTNSP